MTNDQSNAPIMESYSDQPSFVGVLPSDIVLLIFSHLTQQDCLSCMAVCHTWYCTIPLCVQHVWETVSFNNNDIYKVNKRRELCLGEHTRKVVFDRFSGDEPLYHMMQKLLAWNCLKIKSMEFRGCSTEDLVVFHGVLRQLASRLTHLEMSSHLSNVSFLHIFSVCPSLTHFSYTPSLNQYQTAYCSEPTVPGSTVFPDKFPNIIYLAFGSPMNAQYRLAPVLRRCPHLRSFICPNKSSMGGFLTGIFTDRELRLNQLLSWCPNIAYLENASIAPNLAYTPIFCIREHAYSDDDMIGEKRGLRRLGASGNYSCNEISQALTESQSTLEYVSLGRDDSFADWTFVFRSLCFPCLGELILYGLAFDAGSLVVLLNRCPSINTLALRSTPLTFDLKVCRTLHVIQKLRVLELSNVQVEDEYSMTTIIQRLPALENLKLISSTAPLILLANIQHLDQLYISNVTWKSSQPFEESARNLLTIPSLAVESKLKELSLIGTKITYEILLHIANSPYLQALSVKLDGVLSHGETGLYQFVSLLKEKTAANTLRLYNMRSVSYDTLNILAAFPYLEKLSTGYIRQSNSKPPLAQISKTGLMQLLRKNTKVELLDFKDVELVDEDNNVLSIDSLVMQIHEELPSFTAASTKSWYFGAKEVTGLLIKRKKIG